VIKLFLSIAMRNRCKQISSDPMYLTKAEEEPQLGFRLSFVRLESLCQPAEGKLTEISGNRWSENIPNGCRRRPPQVRQHMATLSPVYIRGTQA